MAYKAGVVPLNKPRPLRLSDVTSLYEEILESSSKVVHIPNLDTRWRRVLNLMMFIYETSPNRRKSKV
jgi:hypothetical protein